MFPFIHTHDKALRFCTLKSRKQKTKRQLPKGYRLAHKALFPECPLMFQVNI